MTNILAIPLVNIDVAVANTEDWVDSIKFVVDTGVAIDLMPQLDIRGITFDMEVRRAADDPEVVLGASTTDGTLKIGDLPDVGFLIFNIPFVQMRDLIAGTYVGDILAHDDIYTRVVVNINLTVVEGVTRQPVNKRVVVEAA